jgi:hypothetical protein
MLGVTVLLFYPVITAFEYVLIVVSLGEVDRCHASRSSWMNVLVK